MVYFYNNEYYVLVSSDKLVKAKATLNKSGGVTYTPTGVKVRLNSSEDFKKYKSISNDEVIKALSAPKKEIKVKEDFSNKKFIKSKDID